MSYFPKPSLNENDLAIIERADTASRAYSAGQYVSWHGRTGRVKAAILQGATLSVNLFDYESDGLLNILARKPITLTPISGRCELMYNYSFEQNGIAYLSFRVRALTTITNGMHYLSGAPLPDVGNCYSNSDNMWSKVDPSNGEVYWASSNSLSSQGTQVYLFVYPINVDGHTF